MSVSVIEDEDVLQLLTGEDEFDADIDEDAEEELLRDDVTHSSAPNDPNRHQTNAVNVGQSLDQQNQKKMATNESIEDEEDDDDRDSGRRGRFRSERIMSLASVPTRRRDIPDSLEAVNVKNTGYDKNKGSDNHRKRNDYNNRRHNSQQNYRNYNQNQNPVNEFINRFDGYRPNNSGKGLLPLPPQAIAGHQIHPQPLLQQQHRNYIPQQNLYGPPLQPNPNNPINTIHVNPHFRARLAGNQFEQQVSQALRPSLDQPIRLPINPIMPSRPQFPTQSPNNSQSMLMNPQIRSHFVGNNGMQFNDQNMSQLAPPLQSSQQQSLLSHPSNQSSHHQLQLDNQWRIGNNGPQFPMQHSLGQPMIGQQLPLNRPQMQTMHTNRMLNQNQLQQNFSQNHQSFAPNSHYQSNSQPLYMTSPGAHPSLQLQQNNYNNQYQQPMETQRFPVHSNYNQNQQLFGSQQSSQSFQTSANQQLFNNNNNNNINLNNNNNNSMTQLRQMSPQKAQMRQNAQKRPNFRSQAPSVQAFRANKPLVGSGAYDQQRGDGLRASQLKTKRAKQLLSKKQQNVVKEVPIVANPSLTQTGVNRTANTEMEVSVGVDEEYKQKLEEQKRLREEILRKKEERRKAMAAQRLKESNKAPAPPVTPPKTSAARVQPQQQIATLLNRSPQLNPMPVRQPAPKRIVKALVHSNDGNATNKPIVVNNRVVVNPNQKRSVLIKGLAASTTELTVRRLCKPIGAIESCKIVSIGGQKSATVCFVRSQDAQTFQHKYERTLLDLSIIQVSLIWSGQRNRNFIY